MSQDSVKDTKREFEKRFLDGTYYDKQTQDEKHKHLLLSSLHVYGESSILDLGAGSGYMTCAIASKYKDCQVTGLDIVEETLKRNEENAKNLHMINLNYVCYDGGDLPFPNNSFDVVISRYAVHHIAGLQNTFHEICRVLRPGGQCIIADPTPAKEDAAHFIDDYMKTSHDGHQKFYTEEELCQMATNAGLIFETKLYTSITFPRKKSEEVMEVLNKADKHDTECYQIHFIDKDIYLTLPVLNISFFKG